MLWRIFHHESKTWREEEWLWLSFVSCRKETKKKYVCKRKKDKNQRKKEEIFSFPYDINLERDDRVSNNSTFVRVSYAYRIFRLHREKYSRNRGKIHVSSGWPSLPTFRFFFTLNRAYPKLCRAFQRSVWAYIHMRICILCMCARVCVRKREGVNIIINNVI